MLNSEPLNFTGKRKEQADVLQPIYLKNSLSTWWGISFFFFNLFYFSFKFILFFFSTRDSTVSSFYQCTTIIYMRDCFMFDVLRNITCKTKHHSQF